MRRTRIEMTKRRREGAKEEVRGLARVAEREREGVTEGKEKGLTAHVLFTVRNKTVILVVRSKIISIKNVEEEEDKRERKEEPPSWKNRPSSCQETCDGGSLNRRTDGGSG